MTENERKIKNILDRYTNNICDNCVDQHSNFVCSRCPLNSLDFINKVQRLTIEREINIYYDE